MQSSHLVFRTEKAKCSLCIEMRVEPHSKVVSRRECDIRSAGKTSTSWEELASAKSTSTTASTAGLRPPVSSIRRGLKSLLTETLRQKRDADAYVRSAEPLSDEMLRRKTAHSKTPKRPTQGLFMTKNGSQKALAARRTVEQHTQKPVLSPLRDLLKVFKPSTDGNTTDLPRG